MTTRTALHLVRLGAGVAAIVLAVLSRGDVISLGVLLTVLAWRPAALCVLPALLAAAWRWGSTSLDALAGAQAVLGPAIVVGPTSAAAASALAGVALLLIVPTDLSAGRGPWVAAIPSLATGAAVAVVTAGAGPGGELLARVAVGVAASAAAVGCVALRRSGSRVARVLDAGALTASLAAVLAVSRAAPGWAGTFDASALGEGVAVGASAILLVVTGGWAVAAMGNRRA